MPKKKEVPKVEEAEKVVASKKEKPEVKEKEVSKFPFNIKVCGQQKVIIGETDTDYIATDGCTYSKN